MTKLPTLLPISDFLITLTYSRLVVNDFHRPTYPKRYTGGMRLKNLSLFSIDLQMKSDGNPMHSFKPSPSVVFTHLGMLISVITVVEFHNVAVEIQ